MDGCDHEVEAAGSEGGAVGHAVELEGGRMSGTKFTIMASKDGYSLAETSGAYCHKNHEQATKTMIHRKMKRKP